MSYDLKSLKAAAMEGGLIEHPIAEIIEPELRSVSQYPAGNSSNNLAHVTNMARRSKLLEKIENN